MSRGMDTQKKGWYWFERGNEIFENETVTQILKHEWNMITTWLKFSVAENETGQQSDNHSPNTE